MEEIRATFKENLPNASDEEISQITQEATRTGVQVVQFSHREGQLNPENIFNDLKEIRERLGISLD